MFSTKFLILATLAAVASAAPKPCKPTPTLPSTGGTYTQRSTAFAENSSADIWQLPASELPAVPSNLVLKKIILGHGIQNYSCPADPTATPEAKGALAALYDVTHLYPGTPRTGLTQAGFDTLTTTALWTQDIPLNLVNAAAALASTILPSKNYAATTDPFQAPEDIVLGNSQLKYAGHHYFDQTGTPNFDLPAAGLKAHVVKKAGVPVPAGADPGPLKTGAVQWLLLGDSGLGLSKGVNMVYRVITAGGVGESCATTGEGQGSVPYTAFYWFYG